MQVTSKFYLSKLAEYANGRANPWSGQLPCPSEHWYSGYTPTYLTHVTQVFADSKVDLLLIAYLPYLSCCSVDYAAEPQQSCSVQIKVNNGSWQTLNPPEPDRPYWTLMLKRVKEGSRLLFRYQDKSNRWQPIAPLGNMESVFGTSYVPSLRHLWVNQPPRFDHARVLLETTLEGLLAGYKSGKFAPASIEELFASSIAQRILQTDIPGQLAAQGIDEIMVPICSSVADRSHLDPKFNYLTYNFVDVDWQIGQSHDFKALIDKLYGQGIQLVPDLIFAHQVKTPFEGSLDQMSSSDEGEEVFVDHGAFLFRDYGTWMLNLSKPEIRKMLVEKVVAFVTQYRLKVIRIDYVDGLILQYSNREHNHAEDFIRELKAELQRICPDVVLLGETFEMANNEAVQNFIDVFYTPIGFSILEELYYPLTKRSLPLHPDVEALAAHMEEMLRSKRQAAFYAQLHDEAWYCPHIQQGRPTVSWAYGGQPAQLAKKHGESLVDLGLLERSHLLDYVRRMVRNVEAMTMFLSNFRYMYTPGVDSLSLGCLDSPGEWKVSWEGVPPSQMKEWQNTGLSSREIFLWHDQHRSDMVRLRNIFRQYTKLDPDTHQPLTHLQIHHVNPEASLISLFRANHIWLYDSLLVVFNVGSNYFAADHPYELPVPKEFEGKWEILFDGDWVDAHKSLSPSALKAYEPGTVLETTPGHYSNFAAVLNLNIGARSLVVMRYQNCLDLP